jgi:predicted lipid-binding transport protein (Tim44 family)
MPDLVMEIILWGGSATFAVLVLCLVAAQMRPGERGQNLTSALLAGMVTIEAGCAIPSTGLEQMADEGRGIVQQVGLKAPPEEKLRAAEAALAHADKYDQLINRSTSLDYTAKARGVQRQEREAAALLMRTAANDYVKQRDIQRARAVYKSIIYSFDEQEYGPVRRSATSALDYLDSDNPL